MKFISTRGGSGAVSIRQAIEAGLASDGGLFVPGVFPSFNASDFNPGQSHADIASILLAPFFADDPTLSEKLPEICARAFDFVIPLTPVPGRRGDFILELFHGPTSAFKDVGARFLAACLEVMGENDSSEKRTVLVATSGDTGGAVASAFFEKKNIDVVILYPEGRISQRQEKQLCAWGGNINAFAVNGSFDDCQRIVKAALSDPKPDRHWLSANSINLGRILPQMVYYAHAAVALSKPEQNPPGFIIPSGNLGNSLACVWAKKLGFEIGPIHLAFNANRGVVDYLQDGQPSKLSTVSTLANAMDVSKPSNLERLQMLYPKLEALQAQVTASTVSDAEIRNEIKVSQKEWGQVLCPHSAIAAVARKHLVADSVAKASRWVLVATAHPAKFESIVEPLVGHSIAIPEKLAPILKQESKMVRIGNQDADFQTALAAQKIKK